MKELISYYKLDNEVIQTISVLFLIYITKLDKLQSIKG